ncbi:TetR/AcrR family transcriptional regulator [Brevibacterium yomogidense]|uniref:TetR/AcrR family transcriptional regulator n=1 Tax=Brevibacterium yomogidense TaxID=946573 RepID=UPI0018DF4539|nr:TetR/AcrR family transcriptional regulator [Brevibacterium yomogidense]
MKAQPIRDVNWTAARDIRRELESETKDALIAAARSVFLSKGFDGATIGEIAAVAEVSRPTFYVYFATKSEMFRVVASRLRDELLDAHHHPRSVADDPVVLSRASVEAFVGLYVENIELLDEVAKQSTSDPVVATLLDEMVGKPFRRTHRHIIRLREAGDAHPIVNEQYVAHLMRAVNIDAAGEVRKHPELKEFYIDQATRAYLAMIGYTGDMSKLRISPDESRIVEEDAREDAGSELVVD